jgi:hypothetical protein
VDDEVSVVHQHPGSLPVAFGVERTDFPRAQHLVDGIGEGLDLPLAGTAHDEEEVGEVTHLGQIQDPQIHRLARGCGSDRLTDPIRDVGGRVLTYGLWIHR